MSWVLRASTMLICTSCGFFRILFSDEPVEIEIERPGTIIGAPEFDTRGEPEPTFAVAIDVEAEFAWNNELGRIVTPTFGGRDAGPASFLELRLYGDLPNGLQQTEQCSVVVNLDGFGAVAAEDLTNDAQWQIFVEPGFTGDSRNPQFPEGRKPVVSDCTEQGFSDEQYPDNPGGLVEFWGSLPWVISALPGPLTESLRQELMDRESEPDVEELWIQSRLGGEYAIDDLPFRDNVFLSGFEMDSETNDVATEGAEIVAPRILNGEVAAMPSGELPTGFYRYGDFVLVVNLSNPLTFDPATYTP
ncbi:MAG: hypothetical protein AAF602_21310 [Myxococcota bacterium]